MRESAEDASAREVRIRSGIAVIAGVSGLEGLIERDGDEAAFAELRAAIGLACEVAESMGGSVDEAHGDWVLATFGLAPAIENISRVAQKNASSTDAVSRSVEAQSTSLLDVTHLAAQIVELAGALDDEAQRFKLREHDEETGGQG